MAVQVPKTIITFTGLSQWVTVDLNNFQPVPAGSNFAIIRVAGSSSTVGQSGCRAAGSSDDIAANENATNHSQTFIVRLNVEGEIELYRSHEANFTFYIWGYGSEINWITPVVFNGNNTSGGSSDSWWRTKDLSAVVPVEAKYAVIRRGANAVSGSSGSQFRAVGEARTRNASISTGRYNTRIIALNASRELAVNDSTLIATTDHAWQVEGWIAEGNYKYLSDPTGYPLETASQWTAWPSPDSDLVFAAMESTSGASTTGYRKNASDTVPNTGLVKWSFEWAPTDTGGNFEYYSTITTLNYWQRGGFIDTAPASGPTITNVPNMTRGIQATITGTGFGT